MAPTATAPTGSADVAPLDAPVLELNRSRLALLDDVDDGLVVFVPSQGAVLNLATLPPRSVLSETAELRRAGWIDVDLTEGADTLGSFPYAVTDAGRVVLEERQR